MLDHCDKHGPYSAFCRECDLETIEEAMKPTPTTAMIEAAELADSIAFGNLETLLNQRTRLSLSPGQFAYQAIVDAVATVKALAAAPHPTKPQPLAFEDQAYAAYADHSEAGEAICAFAEYALKPQPEMGEPLLTDVDSNGRQRSATGETVLGFPVVAYRETHPDHGSAYGHIYSEHWSTPNWKHPNVTVERLFTEADLRRALSSQRAEGIEAETLRLLRADLAEEDAERHAQRIAVIDDALTQDAG